MSQTNLIEKLRSSKFFAGVDDEHLKRLAAICQAEEFPARSTVFEEFERAKKVYVILSGEISLAICEPDEVCKQIAVVHAGDLMGWSPLVGRARLYDTARALTPVKALVFDGESLMDYCEKNPVFGFHFMHRVACTLAERLSGTRLQLLEMSGVHLPEFPLESDA
jgi:CRP/FNR family transcriptional regulator, cyclic AMP receptor protein